MNQISNLIISTGIFLFSLAIINISTADNLTPSLERAEILSCITSIIIIGLGAYWIKITPKVFPKVNLKGNNGFFVDDCISKSLKDELAWGTHQILTATAAATILIYIDEKTVLKRGLIKDELFEPGMICENVSKKNKLTSLANTSNYPGSYEFDSIINNLPSILISPISDRGYVIVGGWSIRCFSKSDEIWINGWCKKLIELV
tara:strand:- start:4930 stop:5541 length:612 start_codon:yes stop_codon:yes gene_type:complete